MCFETVVLELVRAFVSFLDKLSGNQRVDRPRTYRRTVTGSGRDCAPSTPEKRRLRRFFRKMPVVNRDL
jgi:hypothetical protein